MADGRQEPDGRGVAVTIQQLPRAATAALRFAPGNTAGLMGSLAGNLRSAGGRGTIGGMERAGANPRHLSHPGNHLGDAVGKSKLCIAEFERELIRERTVAGLKAALAPGREGEKGGENSR